jgi:integrase
MGQGQPPAHGFQHTRETISTLQNLVRRAPHRHHVERIESWKARRLNEGRSPATVLRDLFTLSSVLRRAIKAGELTENPVRRIDKPRIDRRGKVRFLDQAEESRLRKAMKARDEELQDLRTSGNVRRQHRHEKLLPQLPHFGDHLTPAVLLSMNTGLRRGELLELHWRSIDFSRRLLTIEGPNAKSRQTRHVPLNEEAVNTLRRCRQQSGPGARVFDVATGFKGAWGKLLKRARITHFRWQDLRHHFASRLVQRGVPLNTVRDLLGHSSVQMSLRYAHLAPDQRREAVAKINDHPVLALTLRLPWEGMPPTWRYPIDFMVEREGLEPSTPADRALAGSPLPTNPTAEVDRQQMVNAKIMTPVCGFATMRISHDICFSEFTRHHRRCEVLGVALALLPARKVLWWAGAGPPHTRRV